MLTLQHIIALHVKLIQIDVVAIGDITDTYN